MEPALLNGICHNWHKMALSVHIYAPNQYGRRQLRLRLCAAHSPLGTMYLPLGRSTPKVTFHKLFGDFIKRKGRELVNSGRIQPKRLKNKNNKKSENKMLNSLEFRKSFSLSCSQIWQGRQTIQPSKILISRQPQGRKELSRNKTDYLLTVMPMLMLLLMLCCQIEAT